MSGCEFCGAGAFSAGGIEPPPVATAPLLAESEWLYQACMEDNVRPSRARLRAIEVAAQAPILAALRNLLPYTSRETKTEGQYCCTVCDADLTHHLARSSAVHDPECEAGAAWDAAYGAGTTDPDWQAAAREARWHPPLECGRYMGSSLAGWRPVAAEEPGDATGLATNAVTHTTQNDGRDAT